MDTPPNALVRFGVFELDARAGELRRSGRRVALQPQPLEILQALIERPGEVVTREELRCRLWSNGAYVDFDRSLNKAVGKLRDALGDDADSPRYIETLPRHGYRFIPLPQAHADATTAPPRVSAPSALRAATASAGGREEASQNATASSPAVNTASPGRLRLPTLTLIAALAAVVLLAGVYALLHARTGTSVTDVRAAAPSQSELPGNVPATGAAAFSPPPHSIVVLPFVDLGGDASREYLSDGLTEELLNSLSRIDGLQVVGRTSSFYFKGKDVETGTVGRRLNVAAVLEGSVRRSAHTVRVAARLTNTVTGYQLWSETYDRDLGDMLSVQSEIANAVAATLKVRLLADIAARIELGGTRNPAAFDAYLRASRIFWSATDERAMQEAVAGFAEAVALDPDYALAHVARSIALLSIQLFNPGPSRNNLETAQAEALRAAQLAPELADTHLALALVAATSLDFASAQREFERAMALAPGSERILRDYSGFAAAMGHIDSGIAAARRALQLNPLDQQSYGWLADALEQARRYDAAIAVLNDAIALGGPQDALLHVHLGVIYYELGNFDRSRSECEMRRDYFGAQICLAATYEKLGRHRDAQAELARLRASAGDAGAYFYAEIYAQWGDAARALQWLEKAVRLRDSGVCAVQVDPLMDPLRKEPRYQAVVRALGFPD